MPFLNRNINKIIIIIIVIAIVVIMAYTNKERLNLSFFERTIGNILTPINNIFASIGKSTSDKVSSIKSKATLKEENERLKTELEVLKEDNRISKNIIGQRDYLRNEYEFRKKTKYKFVEAKITGKEPDSWFYRFTINKGSKDGVKKNDTVIQAIEADDGIITEGIIGRVQDVGDNWAKIVTIIDYGNKLSFKTVRTLDGGILTGDIDGELNGYFFDNGANATIGDEIITAGLGGVVLEDIYIGKIIDINTDNELVKKIVIKPSVDFKKLYKVNVIIGEEE